MKKLYISSILFLLLIGATFYFVANKEAKSVDGKCKAGYSSQYVFTGGDKGYYTPCIKNAVDAGVVCEINSQCSTGYCIPLETFVRNCADQKSSCENITGTCSENKSVQVSIPKKNSIYIVRNK
jgi:hypothetical protein